MHWLTIHVVDDGENPLIGESVKIVIHHGGLFPDTSLEEYTQGYGVTHFYFEGGSSADVYVGGVCQLEAVDVDDDYAVSV